MFKMSRDCSGACIYFIYFHMVFHSGGSDPDKELVRPRVILSAAAASLVWGLDVMDSGLGEGPGGNALSWNVRCQ